MILILLVNDNIIISLSHKDQVFWLIYVIISNLDTKMR